jgi:hypothetical protein
MFVSHEFVLESRFEIASARLVALADGTALAGISARSFDGNEEALLRVGPLSADPGFSKLVQVHTLTPIHTDLTTIVSMRWEATGVTGGLFPVLDADLILVRAGRDQARLRLMGSYRPPLGRAGAALDRVILHRLATATVHAFLRDLAIAIVDVRFNGPDRTGATGWRPLAELDRA